MDENQAPAERSYGNPSPRPEAAGYSLRRARIDDAPRIAELVEAAYGHYVERIGMKPGPMTDNYDRLVREAHVTVAERDGVVEGVIVLRSTILLVEAIVRTRPSGPSGLR